MAARVARRAGLSSRQVRYPGTDRRVLEIYRSAADDPGPNPPHEDRSPARRARRRAGDRIAGAVGYEWDAVAPECAGRTPPLTVLAQRFVRNLLDGVTAR